MGSNQAKDSLNWIVARLISNLVSKKIDQPNVAIAIPNDIRRKF
jgi:hypothetical protein